MRLGIVGATGWLGQALGLGVLEKGLAQPGDLVLLNRSGRVGGYQAHPGVRWANDLADLQARSDVIVLSVRPEDFPPLGFDPGARLVISFMAAWTMESLSRLAPRARLVRAMPNGNAVSRQSFTPWLAAGLTGDDRAITARILSAMGQEQEIETEAQLDYLTALSGSGAAYPGLMAKAMLEDAAARGLPPDVAHKAVEAVICGSSGLLAGQMGRVAEILDAYMSYRGITAAGLDAAQAAGFGDAIRAALQAATLKAAAMGQPED